MKAHTIYNYQQQMLRILLAWGAGNTLLGAPLALSRNQFLRQFGMQAVSWGAIDAILAIFGITNATKKAAHQANGLLEEGAAQEEARSFRRILLINAGLDLLYIAAGLATIIRNPKRADRQGMGWGIVVQGVFLLFYDALLARDVEHRFLLDTPL